MPKTADELRYESASPILDRAASYNHLPSLNTECDDVDIKRTLSEANIPQSHESWTLPKSDDVTTGKAILRQSSLRSKREKAKGPQFTLPDDTTENVELPAEEDILKSPERLPKPRSMAGALADRFRRKKWRSSRSPSPTRQPGNSSRSNEEHDLTTNDRAINRQRRKSLAGPAAKGPVDSEDTMQHNAMSTQTARHGTSVTGKVESQTTLTKKRSIKTLRRRASLDRFTASVGISTKGAPPVPKPPKYQENSLKPSDIPRPKDELWSVFRGLDSDYQKFQSKSSTFKANVVRLTLIPCLSRYADHPSTKCLRPEDLDRRINILNKWWTGLLEMLNGKNSLSLTGTDRPVYLNAILAIMARPEWRIPPFSHPSPVAPSVQQKQGITATSNTSLESTGSDFLLESIYHNIRNIFAQNLLSQLAFCIDRMSMRHTPASLVPFCGKTCAYAFFYCPQVADMLVRVWNLNPDHLRKIANRFTIDPSLKARVSVSEDMATNFPTPVRSLAFASHASLVRYLRRKTFGPLAASHIDWSGPWSSRWMGCDSELFSVFVKHFHILVAEFLPEDTNMPNLVYVPGLVPVHAQILAVLENTLNKQCIPPPLDAMHGPTSVTFDDLIDGSDAPATALPLGAANKYRTMSENRLIMLLRDFLRDSTIRPSTKQMFAESFCEISKSAARRTSLFNHSGCFVLCDFVEELMSVIPPYCQSTGQPDLLDWEFWLDVSKQMLQSNNSVTEMRAFAFLFAAWDAINALEKHKEQLCLHILLQERLFYEYFSHWSPMVRAYFHRLLCWRVARHDGEESELDTRIFLTLSDRLSKIYNYLNSFQAKAEKLSIPSLSTVPCPPAPGRRLIIIRNDYDYPGRDSFAGLINIIPSNLDSSAQQSEKSNTTNGDAAETEPQFKRGWRMLKTMFSSPSNPKPGEVTPPDSKPEDTEFPSIDGSKNTQATTDGNKSPSETNAGNSGKPHRRSSFRFTLEWSDRQRRVIQDRYLFPPPLPSPAQEYLKTVQAKLTAQSDSASTSNSVTGSGSAKQSDSDIEEDEESPLTLIPTDDSVPVAPAQAKTLPWITPTNVPKPPTSSYVVESKYAGRALAEWALVVSECDNFFTRRREEGVPSDKLVEVPTLCVENFRKC